MFSGGPSSCRARLALSANIMCNAVGGTFLVSSQRSGAQGNIKIIDCSEGRAEPEFLLLRVSMILPHMIIRIPPVTSPDIILTSLCHHLDLPWHQI